MENFTKVLLCVGVGAVLLIPLASLDRLHDKVNKINERNDAFNLLTYKVIVNSSKIEAENRTLKAEIESLKIDIDSLTGEIVEQVNRNQELANEIMKLERENRPRELTAY